jgi:hypothetical protein
MTDTSAGGVKVHPMVFCEFFNLAVFCEVGFRLVLDVVVEREDGLLGVEDFGALQRQESKASDERGSENAGM